MELTAFEIALIAGGFGITGTLLGALINHYLSLGRSRHDAKRFAGFRLREAFAPELAKLQHPEGRGIAEFSDILETAFEKHQMAVNEFRFFLTDDKLDSFNKAWREYYSWPYEDKPNFSKHMMLSKEDIQKTIDEITAILEFTKDK